MDRSRVRIPLSALKNMITSKIIKIKYTNDNTIIEQELKAKGLDPRRWAVIHADENELTLCVSFVKKY